MCNISKEMEAENNILEKSTTESNEDTYPILDCGPSDLNVKPGELMYILVIILEGILIILIQMSH